MRCGFPPNAPDGMQKGVVIELDERLERDVEAFAVIKDGAMVIGNPPRPRIEIKSLFEFAGLLEAAEFGKRVAAAQRPVAASRAAIEFQDLNLVAGLAQLQRRRHAGKTGAKDQDGRAPHIAGKLDRALVSGIRGKAEARHGVIHRRAAGDRADQRQEIAPAESFTAAALHGASYPGRSHAQYRNMVLRQRPRHRATEARFTPAPRSGEGGPRV